MGVRAPAAGPDAAARVRRRLSIPDAAIVFAAFGKMTTEKRIGPILLAFRELVTAGTNAYLLLIGDASEYAALARETAGLDRVRATGHVEEAEIGAYLHCLAAHRATVITALAHLADVPAIDPRDWQPAYPARRPVAVAIDLLDEARSLRLAMQRLATDRVLRDELARNGHEYWARHHTLDLMDGDYRRVMSATLAREAPVPTGLPAHMTNDYSDAARRIARQFDTSIDILR
jgi:hypothetical protein